MTVKTAGRNGKATRASGKPWKLVSASEATPRKLEEPNTSVVLTADETAWFRKVNLETAKRSAASRASASSRVTRTSKKRP